MMACRINRRAWCSCNALCCRLCVLQFRYKAGDHQNIRVELIVNYSVWCIRKIFPVSVKYWGAKRRAVLAKYYVGYQIKKIRMGWACGTYAGELHIGFCWRARRKQTTCRSWFGLGRGIILKWIVNMGWGLDWIEDRGQVAVSCEYGNLLTSWETVNFSRRNVPSRFCCVLWLTTALLDGPQVT